MVDLTLSGARNVRGDYVLPSQTAVWQSHVFGSIGSLALKLSL